MLHVRMYTVQNIGKFLITYFTQLLNDFQTALYRHHKVSYGFPPSLRTLLRAAGLRFCLYLFFVKETLCEMYIMSQEAYYVVPLDINP